MRQIKRRCRPTLERLEDRRLLAIAILPGVDFNISQENDNQAEPTIAINTLDPQKLFAASMTFHGSLNGAFDSAVNVQSVFKDHKPGLFVATSNDQGVTWTKRIALTGGPSEPLPTQRSLPAAIADPQATFDSFGNLFVTYLAGSPNPLQFGTSAASGLTNLIDPNRAWVTDMWAGKILTIFRDGLSPQSLPILCLSSNL